MEDFINRVADHQSDFTKLQKNIADFLAGNLNKAAFNTLESLAEEIGTSTTSVIRFSRVLGYDGFSDMQSDIQEYMNVIVESKVKIPQRNNVDFSKGIVATGNELLDASFIADMNNIKETLEAQNEDDLNNAVELITDAKNVYIVGMRSSFSIAYYMYSRLSGIRKNVRIINALGMDYPEQIAGVGEGDVCIAYIFPRYSKVTASIMSFMKNAGAKVIIVSGTHSQLIGEYGDLILPCAVSSVSYINSPVGAVAVTNYLAMCVASNNRQEMQEIIKKTDLLMERGFYLGI